MQNLNAESKGLLDLGCPSDPDQNIPAPLAVWGAPWFAEYFSNERCNANLYIIDLVLLTFGACHIPAQSLFQPKKKGNVMSTWIFTRCFDKNRHRSNQFTQFTQLFLVISILPPQPQATCLLSSHEVTDQGISGWINTLGVNEGKASLSQAGRLQRQRGFLCCGSVGSWI